MHCGGRATLLKCIRCACLCVWVCVFCNWKNGACRRIKLYKSSRPAASSVCRMEKLNGIYNCYWIIIIKHICIAISWNWIRCAVPSAHSTGDQTHRAYRSRSHFYRCVFKTHKVPTSIFTRSAESVRNDTISTARTDRITSEASWKPFHITIIANRNLDQQQDVEFLGSRLWFYVALLMAVLMEFHAPTASRIEHNLLSVLRELRPNNRYYFLYQITITQSR